MLSQEARHFLEEVRFGVLAIVGRGGRPHQSVMWYELQGDEILMNTSRGRVKERILRHDPRVSLCVTDGPRWVTLSGTAYLNDDPLVAQADIAHLAVRYEGPIEGAKEVEHFRKEERVTIRVPIEHVIERGFGDD